MADVLGLISNLVTPFFEHPVFLFFFILLVVGVDASIAFNNELSGVTLPSNTPYVNYSYVITYGANWFGGADYSSPYCYAKGTGEPSLVGEHRPSALELQTLCLHKNDLGTFGGIFTQILNSSGDLANIQELKDAKVSSWMIFALMLFTTLLVWAVTASTRS